MSRLRLALLATFPCASISFVPPKLEAKTTRLGVSTTDRLDTFARWAKEQGIESPLGVGEKSSDGTPYRYLYLPTDASGAVDSALFGTPGNEKPYLVDIIQVPLSSCLVAENDEGLAKQLDKVGLQTSKIPNSHPGWICFLPSKN